MQKNGKALVVFSGGQDSTTCLYWALARFAEVHCITFDYGQRHAIEIEAALRIANMAKVNSHEVVQVPNCLISSSPLTSNSVLESTKTSRLWMTTLVIAVSSPSFQCAMRCSLPLLQIALKRLVSRRLLRAFARWTMRTTTIAVKCLFKRPNVTSILHLVTTIVERKQSKFLRR